MLYGYIDEQEEKLKKSITELQAQFIEANSQNKDFQKQVWEANEKIKDLHTRINEHVDEVLTLKSTIGALESKEIYIYKFSLSR